VRVHGNVSVDPIATVGAASRPLFQTRLYLLHPWSRGRDAGDRDLAWQPHNFRSPDLMESSAIPISFFLIPKGGFG